MPLDYKKQKWDRGPIYSNISKDNSLGLHQLSEQRISKGKKKVIPNWNKTLINFKQLSSKDNPSQFERNLHTPNCNYR